MGMFDYFANDPTSHDAMALRQRIALQMLSQRKGYPKTFGEGLGAIGDAIGDRFTMRRLEEMQAKSDEAAAQAAKAGLKLPGPARASPGSTDPSAGAQPAAIDAGSMPSEAMPSPRTRPVMAPPTGRPGDTGATSFAPPVQQPPLAAAVPPPTRAMPPPAMATQPPLPPAETAPASLDSRFDAAFPNKRSEMEPPPDTPVVAEDVPLPMPDPRGRAAMALMAQTAPGVPQPNPTMPPAGGANPQLAQMDIRPAPPIQTIRPAPPIKPASAASEPVPPTPAEPRYQAPPQFTRPGQFETPPRIADPSAQQVYYERLSKDPRYSPSQQQGFAERAAEADRMRKEDQDQQMKAFETRNRLVETQAVAEQEALRNKGKHELELQAAEQARQASEYKERITRHLGGRDPAAIEQELVKSRASVANIPAIADSIQRTKNVVDKMYTGAFADADTFLSQVLPGFDPARGTATQQFKTAMTDVMAAHRAAVVGPGSQSGPELALLQKSTAADVKLNKDTIKEAVDAAERMMVKTAIAHQKQVQLYAGNFDPDRTRQVYGSFEVPGMENIVPQVAVNKLMLHQDNKQARDYFDETYHTPGLAERVIRLRGQR